MARAVNGEQEDTGRHAEFNAAWENADPQNFQLFTRGKPRDMVQFWQRAYFEDLWEYMGAEAATARCLEIGSGRATTSMYLASRGCRVTLVDLAPRAFELAKANFAREGLPEPACLFTDARATGLPAASFDAVYSIGLLEHFEDPRPVLAEALRLLAPGGRLFMVIVPDVPRTRRLLAYTVLRPDNALSMAAGLVLPPKVKERVKGILGLGRPNPETARDFFRTEYTGKDYEAWMRELGAEGARCVPYNPYHWAYRSMLLTRGFQLPLYTAWRALKRGWPRLQTWASTASCDLLFYRKPGAPPEK
jgi:SAM-dependent methyltransferase